MALYTGRTREETGTVANAFIDLLCSILYIGTQGATGADSGIDRKRP
jgi:hypothetical protein